MAIVKPSELAPASSAVCAEIARDTFAEDHVAVIEGGIETSQALLARRWDHIFYTGGNYYRYDRGYWYSSPRYNGHWARAHWRGLPPELTRHRYEQIRYYRDRDCRHHLEARDHRHGHWRDHDGRDDHRGDWRRHDRDRGERHARGYGERRL